MENNELLARIEQGIIIKGLEQGIIPVQRDKIVPLREGKLDSTPFGDYVGKTFDCDRLLAINFYGHFKLSSEIMKAVDSVKEIFFGVRSIKANIVHFNSIKTEDVRDIAGDDKALFLDYVELKKNLLDLRFGDKRSPAGRPVKK